jgi:ribonuclease Z
MRPSFHPRLINDQFSDPGLYIPFLFEKRAMLFDLGEISSLTAKDLLKIDHVFVTHAHMDHFIGFDTLLRIFLGRDKVLHLYGPPGFFRHVEGKLAGYAWNLVKEYDYNFIFKVVEIHEGMTLTKIYECREGFAPQEPAHQEPFSGRLLSTPAFHVEAVLLDHRIPCLGLSLVENFYINIIKEGLERLGLEIGPWINEFKKSLYDHTDLSSPFSVTWKEKYQTIKEKVFLLGDLAKDIARISPGQKIAYISDVAGSPENREKIINLARGAEHLFIEAAFMEEDRDAAWKKYHLTAREAGELAGEAGVKRFTLFHFSPRYSHRADEIQKEALDAFIRIRKNQVPFKASI